MLRRMFWMMMLVMAGFVTTVAGATNISISGLNGAQHWAWYEAEDTATAGMSLAGLWRDTTVVSGWWFNPDAVLNSFNWNGYEEWIEFQFTAPADFANAQLYFRYGSTHTNTSSVLIDGVNVTSYTINATSDYTIPTTLEANNFAAIGALSAGTHTVRLVHPYSYNERGFDGFMIYDGPYGNIFNSLDNYGGPVYMQAPDTLASPVIGSSATPVIAGTGSGTLTMYLNGAAYDGSTISTPGDYNLKVLMIDGGNHIFAMSGANFTLVPEPMTMSLLGLGALLAWRKRS